MRPNAQADTFRKSHFSRELLCYNGIPGTHNEITGAVG
mgnify:CR=1 FL=1